MSVEAIGKPVARLDGHAKVTGAAHYAADFNRPGQLYAVLVPATAGLGTIAAIDADPVRALPGVVAVISHLDAPKLPYRAHKGFIDPATGERLHVFQDDQVRFYGQPVAVVVAETLDQAERGAAALDIRYEARVPLVDIAAPEAEPFFAEAMLGDGAHWKAESRRGDADGAWDRAEVRIDARYTIARENHNPMEPHATLAEWDGDRLTLWSKSQFVRNEQEEIAAVFGLAPDQVLVISPFVGGAFGTALRTWPHVTVAALAARMTARPVKLVLSRKQMFFTTGHRPATSQRVAIGASRDGRLSAFIHEGVGETSRYEEFVEALVNATPYMYSCPNLRTRQQLVRLDTGTPTWMRGPGEASGMQAIECAMDELSYALGIDPVELRRRNEPAIDEGAGKPFSSRSLVQCHARGAERFGWHARTPEPRSMRDGRLLIGMGVASATYPSGQVPSSARARLLPDGSVEIEAAASDMGPGTYTSMTQVAAEVLGMEMARIRFALGRSDLPPTPPHGGSFTMASVGSAVRAACLALLDAAAGEAVADQRSPLFGAARDALEWQGGALRRKRDPGTSRTPAEIAASIGRAITAEASAERSAEVAQGYSTHAFGAVFVEVAVDPDVGTIRVRRAHGVYGAGRIINPRLARSQCVGGMIGGIGMALMERTVLDPRDGRPVNAHMADYLLPVNLDIAALDAEFVDEADLLVNPLGAKGIGEIALVGTAPAVANAVYHATGRRVRSLPIRIEDLL